MLDFNYIKQNFVIKYSKYWIILFVLVIVYFIYDYRAYHFKTNKILRNIENAVYVGSGVVINKHNILINKEIAENACIGKYSGLKGKMFAMDKKNTIRVVPLDSSSVLNITVLGTKRNEDTFESYSLLNINNYDNYTGEKVIIPKTVNRSGYFEFKNGKISQNNNSNFFVSIKNTSKKEALLGMPVFNKNYILLGVIKDISKNILNETKRNKILNKSSVQKTYFVNGMEPIKRFLNNKNIPYSMISGDFNFGQEKYNIKDSVVDIICIERY